MPENDVVGLLARATAGRVGSETADPEGDEAVLVTAGRARLPGHLTIPPIAVGIIVFADDCTGPRPSTLGGFVAGVLHGRGWARCGST